MDSIVIYLISETVTKNCLRRCEGVGKIGMNIESISLIKVSEDILSIIKQNKQPLHGKLSFEKEVIINTAKNILEDASYFSQKDPAAEQSIEYVYHSYSAFKAVMYYRISHMLYSIGQQDEQLYYLKFLAKSISEKAKVETGIEIHPAATIGVPFIIDHGIGTVIGETTEIGSRCYFLQGVILGSEGIGNNESGKRHPTIGDDVEIGAHVRVLGPITIGDCVKISPYCVIRDSIPTGAKVVLNTEYQLKMEGQGSILVYGVVATDKDTIAIYGENLKDLQASFICSSDTRQRVSTHVVENSNRVLSIKINVFAEIPDNTFEDKNAFKDISLVLKKKDDVVLIINRCKAIQKILYHQVQEKNTAITYVHQR